MGRREPHAKKTDKGVCDTCGGAGKYKETFSYKNAIIRTCWYCKGTGKVPVKVRYIGESDFQNRLWWGEDYTVASEGDDHYVIRVGRDGLEQLGKELFKEL